MLHHKCTDCLFFGNFNINHINVILLVFFQINLVYVRLFTETCKQTESSYKRYHVHRKNGLFQLSSELGARQAQREVVKIKIFDFAYWAWSTPWGHVLSPITFCRNPALSWAIRYSVFQKVKFTSNFEFVCGNLFSTFWHLMVKFGYIRWF